MAQTNLKLGAMYAVASSFLFASMGALVKEIGDALTNEQAVFIRSAVALLVISPWLLLRHGLSGLRTHRLPDHLLRAGIGLLTMYGFFYAIRHLPLATAMLLNYSAPLYLPIIGLLWLKEKPSIWVYPSSLLGIIGVVFVLNPNAQGDAATSLLSFAGMIGVLSGFGAAMAMASVRRLTDTEPSARIVFYFSLLATLMGALPMPWRWIEPTPQVWLLIISAGLVAACGQLLLTQAYACAQAAQIGPLVYCTVMFSALWGWMLWGESLTLHFALGAMLIVLASILALRITRAESAAPVGAEEVLGEIQIRDDLNYGRIND